MKIIVPCCGRSSRYPNMPPKWLLPASDGIPMIVKSVEGLDFAIEDLVVVILEEHEQAYSVRQGLADFFGAPVRVVTLPEPTRSQSETVARALEVLELDEPFIVKDSDNAFTLGALEQPVNYVSVASLNDFDVVNPRNKSFVTVDNDNIIQSIHEKKVVSDLFSVGGYFFQDPARFLEVFRRLDSDPNSRLSEIYLSDIIAFMVMQGDPFVARRVSKYHDWGTIHEWRQMLESRKLYLASVDGFLFERGFSHFQPRFDEVKPHPNAINAVKRLSDLGHTIVYLSIRPRDLEQATRDMLREHELPEGALVMDCDLSQWTLVTAPHASLPLVTSRAFELSPDDLAIGEKLLGAHG